MLIRLQHELVLYPYIYDLTNYENRKSIFKCYIYVYNFCCNYSNIDRIWIFDVAKGQVNNSISSSLTPGQKAAMCDPNNSKLNCVNSTESKICGLPKSIKSNMSNTTAGPAPSFAPTPSEPGT